ncbi:hypothetical protein KIN20_005870 [Parelaphostrongylus tenuis]|uniref:Uncharacterized protein n=1 Tax=Parelaphostrongylus tenuis TaxID=148309 RepID=A0AAD5M0T7_PARTN|nr:hypothetical protein KIN20_005870 [Parelaphostrongylus tenuis]
MINGATGDSDHFLFVSSSFVVPAGARQVAPTVGPRAHPKEEFIKPKWFRSVVSGGAASPLLPPGITISALQNQLRVQSNPISIEITTNEHILISRGNLLITPATTYELIPTLSAARMDTIVSILTLLGSRDFQLRDVYPVVTQWKRN